MLASITISPIAGDDILNAVEAGSVLPISGTTSNVTDGQTVSVEFNSNSYTTTVTNGAWTLDIPASNLTHGVLPDATYAVNADVTDPMNGNAITSRNLTVDETAPVVTAALTHDTGASGNDSITNNDTLNGSGDANAVVTLTEAGTLLGTTVANGTGAWSFAPASLSDGPHTIIASETDTAGNTGTVSLTFTLDTTVLPPSAPVLAAASDSGASNTDDITNVGLPTFTGTGEDGATVTLLDGSTTIGTGIVSAGTWSITASTTLTEGGNTITASQTDVAGNTSTASGPLSVTLDTTPPAPPSAPVLTPGSDSGASNSDDITNVGLPTFTGTGENGATVTLLDNTTTIGTGIVSAGTWSITASTTLTEGGNTITAEQTDVAGNTSTASTPLNVTLDTTAPAPPSAPVLSAASDSGASSSDDITNVGLPIFTGTGETGATVTLLDNTTTIGTGIVSAGTWSITASTTLTEGGNTITASQTDVAGNTSSASAPLNVTLDTTAPLAPSAPVLAPTSDSGASNTDDITNVPLPIFTGTGEDGATVTLLDGGTAIGTGIVSTGTWSITAATALIEGTNTITATQTDVAGNISVASAPVNVTLDTTAPAAPSAPDMLAFSDSGASDTDNITNATLPVFSGIGENGATVTLLDGGTTIGTGTVTDGTWSITATTPLNEGQNTITAEQTDVAGNTSNASSPLSVTLDTIAPVVTAHLASDTGASGSDSNTNDDALSGTGDVNTVVILTEGATTLGTTTADSTGAWTFTPTSLADGTHTITASETDVAGNTGSVSVAFTLDTAAPAAPSAPVLAPQSDSGASSTDNITSDTQPVFGGTGEEGATVTLLDGATMIGTGTVSAGTWSITATTALIEGNNTITAEQTDVAGNTSGASAPLIVNLDTMAPAPPSTPVLAPGSDSGASSTDDITNSPFATFTGTGEDGATVTLVDSGTTIGTGIVSAGTWSITATTPLAEDSNSITATQTDVAGNISVASAPLSVTLDTIAPAAPGTPVLAPSSDSGASSTDDITNVGRPIFTGTGEEGATVTLLDNTTTIGTGIVSAGTWSITATTALIEGANTITAEQTDVAGNTSSASAPLSVTLDTIAPVVRATLANDTGASSTDSVTGNDTLNGTGDIGAVVTFTEDGTTLGTANADGTGAWSFTPPTLIEGSHTIVASETDIAGNTGSVSVAFTLDTVAPTAPSTPDLAASSDSGSSSTDNITNNRLPSFSGTGESGATVTLLDGITTIGTGTVVGGNWSITATTALTEGINHITAEQTDLAGNTSVASAALSVTLDTIAPAAPSTPDMLAFSDSGSSSTDNITNVRLPIFDGVGENGATVTLLDGSTTIGTGKVSGGTWSITATTPLTEGINHITAEQTDVAGNISVASASLNATLDTIAPVVTAVLRHDTGASSTDSITNNDTLSGTGDANTMVTLKEGGNTLGTTTADGAGAWSFTPPTLIEGSHTIVASETDTAGNTGTVSVAFILDTTAPAAPSGLVLAPGSDSGASSSDDITNVGLPLFTGTGEEGATVTLLDNTTTIGTGIVSAGTWSITATTALTEGTNSITATQTDVAGNTSGASAPLIVTLDTIAPVVTATLTDDTGASSTDSVTSNDALHGTGDPNAMVTFTEGMTTLGSATADGAGAWSFTPTLLPDGPHTITASETDTAGNTGTVSVAFTLDTTAAAPSAPVLASSTDSGASSSDDITNVGRPIFSGTGEDGAIVTLLDNTTTIGTGIVSGGTWSITASTPLIEGANTITATQTDAAGNISVASNPLIVTLDTIAPAPPSTLVLAPSTDSGASSTDDITNVGLPIFSGTGEDGATVTLLDNTTTIGTGIVSTGTWSITATTALIEGANNSITATQTDVAGNISVASAPLIVTLDTIAPMVTAALAEDTGTSSTDSITNNDALSGTGDPGAVVTLKEGVTTLGTTTADGTGAWSFTPTALTDGPHTITASETDTAGNTGTVSVAFTLDTTAAAPSTPDLAPSSDSGASSTDNITNVRRPSFSGTGENGATVTLLDEGTAIGTGVVSGGTWSITAPLSQGSNRITARQTDVAGNVSSASAPLNVTLDTIAPVVTAVLSDDTGISSTDAVTSDATLNGTGDPEAVVTLTEDGTLLGTANADGTGAWSFIPTSLADGEQTITASETDIAGNTGSTSIGFNLDTEAPAAPSAPVLAASSDSGTSDTDNITNVGRPSFSGTGEDGASVTLLDGSTAIGTDIVSGGAWSITATAALSEGSNSITAEQTDLAGNTSSASSPLSVTFDTIAPTVTAVTASPSNASVQVGQTVSFTIGLSEAVTVNATGGEPTLSLSDGATATYVSGSDTDALTFSYTVAAGQASTDLAVTGVNLNGSTITDAAGNAADLTGAAVNPPGTLTIAGVAPVAEFDAAYYLANNPDVAAAGVDPAEHYATVGWTEGRNPDAFFNTDYYLNQNPDVAAAGIDPLTHYETIGWKEGRDPSADFSTDAYLQANPDVAAAGIDPLLHYLEYGAPEGRMAFIAQPHGVGEQNPLVDNTYYFAQNPDVRAAGVNPFTQYDATGWHEGRNPDALFNTNYYLQQNPDVAAAGVDPLLHYEQYGWLEGRNPSPDFSTDAYLNANPDVKAAGINPLVQYEEYGIHEGRAIFHV